MLGPLLPVSNMTIYEPAFQFPFERNYDAKPYLSWNNQNWTVSVPLSILYVVVIFTLKFCMRDREKYGLRLPLAIWSGLLAVFSIFGAVRTIPELAFVWRSEGFEGTACSPAFYHGRTTALWACLFGLSKAWELGDTLFIVLRKTPLIFLHWYHHITVMMYTWFTIADETGPGRWFMVMNYTVHSFMYTYYTLKALRFRMPRPLGMCITSLQISQMVMGLVINVVTYRVKTRGDFCQQTYTNMQYCVAMYFSYLILFVYFFYNSYFRPKATKSEQKSHANGVTSRADVNGNEWKKER